MPLGDWFDFMMFNVTFNKLNVKIVTVCTKYRNKNTDKN